MIPDRFWSFFDGKMWWFTKLPGSSVITQHDLVLGYRRGTGSKPYETAKGVKLYGEGNRVFRIYANGNIKTVANVTIE